MFQTEEQGETPGRKNFNETEMSNLRDKDLRVMVLTKLGRRMDKHSENFDKEMENISTKQK